MAIMRQWAAASAAAVLACGGVAMGQVGISTPPQAPGWWGDTTTPYWGYAEGTGTSPDQAVSNFEEFAVTVARRTDPAGGTTAVFTVTIENGYRPELYKRLFFYIEGRFNTSQDTVPPTNIDYGFQIDEPGVPAAKPTFVRGDAGVRDPGDIWFFFTELEIRPQPDRVVIGFQVEQIQNVDRWWVGETCLPSPAGAAVLALGGLWATRRRR